MMNKFFVKLRKIMSGRAAVDAPKTADIQAIEIMNNYTIS